MPSVGMMALACDVKPPCPPLGFLGLVIRVRRGTLNMMRLITGSRLYNKNKIYQPLALLGLFWLCAILSQRGFLLIDKREIDR